VRNLQGKATAQNPLFGAKSHVTGETPCYGQEIGKFSPTKTGSLIPTVKRNDSMTAYRNYRNILY